jgi:hypothetical protein
LNSLSFEFQRTYDRDGGGGGGGGDGFKVGKFICMNIYLFGYKFIDYMYEYICMKTYVSIHIYKDIFIFIITEFGSKYEEWLPCSGITVEHIGTNFRKRS